MQPSFTCLGPDELKKFIAGDMAPKRVDEIEDHLSTCEACRGSLEATVGDRAWWRDLESALRSDTAGGEYENPESKESVCQRLTALLGPTDDPSMLGRIGAYEIIGLLGYGGMGAVFKARDPGLNRYVAVKILLPHLALSGAARARFRREGQAAAAIIDDCVLPIYAVDEWQGIPYLVMQYTQGVSLQKRIQDRGPLELKEILRIGMQAARGLAAAHAQGLVHRDVKPSNILLDGSVDRALLTDFGLARAVDDASLTTSGMIAGTPQYMSPEQARAESVDHRSDLFSLGSVMYAMCTGHAPFRAESSYSVLRLITDKEPRPIREVNPDVPEWLCMIITKLMAKQFSDRFDSAKEVAELLEACIAHLQYPTMNSLPNQLVVADSLTVMLGRTTSRTYQKMKSSKWIIGSLVAIIVFLIFLVVQSERRSRAMRDIAQRLYLQEAGREPQESGNNTEHAATSVETFPAKVINVNQKSPSGIWKTKQIISAGEIVPPDKAPGEFVFRRNQMIWKFTGKTIVNDRVFDVELDVTKSPKWITLRSQDPKRSQPVLGLFESQGNELRIFTQRDAQGQPSLERPAAIGTGDEPGTDLMILELKSTSVDEMRTYSIDEYVSNMVALWKKSINDAEPSEEAIQAKIAEVSNKLAEDIDGRFGPCNVIEFDTTSKTLIIDHTEQAHRKIEAFLKESIPVPATHAISDPVGDSALVVRTEFDVTNGIEAAQRLEQQAQEMANLPRFYLYANYVSAWQDGMSDEADRSVANFEKAMNERLKPDTPSSTRITAWDEERFLFGYDKPNLDGANGNTRIVNHYFSHEDSIWQRQKTNKDAPQYSKLELPYVWKKVDANAFFHLRSARLTFPWGNSDGNIKFALVPIEFAEYQVVGEETVDGAKCWVVMSNPRRCKLWLDQKSGRLLQMLNYVMQGVESTPFQETPEVEKLCGRKFETLDAFSEFVKSTDQATKQRLAGLYGSLYFDEMAHPIELTRFSEYREIAPGIWFPHQATDVFAGHSPSDPDKFRFSRGELRVINLETGRSLEETIAAFVSEMPE